MSESSAEQIFGDFGRIAELEAEVERQRNRCKNTALAWAHAGEQQNTAATLQAERDNLQAQLRGAQEKAQKYDQWFEKGRCPACHFEEKHMASCPVGMLEGTVAALAEALNEEIKVVSIAGDSAYLRGRMDGLLYVRGRILADLERGNRT